MNWKTALTIFIGSLCVWFPALADKPDDAGVHLTDVLTFEDWPAAAPLFEGTMNCSGGEIEWLDPATPVCAASGRFQLRKLTGYACYFAYLNDGSTEPRLSGVGMYEANGNIGADYTGPIWGTWMIVPSDPEVCDPGLLIDPPVYWKGTWQGRRSLFCVGESCAWIGNLHLVGKGHGGIIDGIHYEATELITTYTPLPIPWEFIPGFPVGGPEGVISATIRE